MGAQHPPLFFLLALPGHSGDALDGLHAVGLKAAQAGEELCWCIWESLPDCGQHISQLTWLLHASHAPNINFISDIGDLLISSGQTHESKAISLCANSTKHLTTTMGGHSPIDTWLRKRMAPLWEERDATLPKIGLPAC